MKMKLLWLGIFFVSSAFGEPCPEIKGRTGNSLYHQLTMKEKCSFSLYPHSVIIPDMIYRSYTFSDDGMIMIFNSLGYGPDSEDTGARTYFIFPRVKKFKFRAQKAQLDFRNGIIWNFDATIARIKNATKLIIEEDHDVNHGNAGGVDIKVTRGILLDAGWSFGSPSHMKPELKSIFSDSKQLKCEVLNADIFKYTYVESGGEMVVDDALFKFKEESDLAVFLKQNCPLLDLSDL